MTGLGWLIITVALTGVYTLVFLWRLPSFIVRLVIRGFARRIHSAPWNRIRGAYLAEAGNDPIVLTSPDVVYVVGVFDVANEPVCLNCRAPDWDTYWSLSLYARNTDNFYLRDASAAPGKWFRIIIAGPKGRHPGKNNEEVVVAPSTKGIIMIRAVIQNRENPADIERTLQLLNATTLAPYSQIETPRPEHFVVAT